MEENGYRGGPTAEGMWGCIVGGLVGAAIFFVLMIGHTLGDCVDEIDCKPSFLLNVILPATAVGGAVCFLIWILVKWLRRSDS